MLTKKNPAALVWWRPSTETSEHIGNFFTNQIFLANYPGYYQVGRMGTLKILSPSEQVAVRLRADLAAGLWHGRMPGVLRLEAELGVNRKAVEAGLRLLEQNGLVKSMGPGRHRRILPRDHNRAMASPLRVAILANKPPTSREGHMVEVLYRLQEAGHHAFFATKCLMQLGSDLRHIDRLVQQTPADAWVVEAGSRGILEWFIARNIPTFGLFGRRRELALAAAGPDKVPAYREVVRHLVRLGHRRTVLLARRPRRLPHPGAPERAFLEELESHGIPTSHYNMPDWEEDAEGLLGLLDSLFKVTPPTALLIDEAYLFHAVKNRLADLGVKVPLDVSLVCTDPDPTFDWCRPMIAHVSWDPGPLLRRVVQWAENVGAGKEDTRQLESPAKFVPGGTMGPAKVWPSKENENYRLPT